jgi:transcriptional regulator with XRE-family HTH domain
MIMTDEQVFDQPQLAARLAEWRRKRGYSKSVAAKKAGVDRSSWTKWETGKAYPTDKNLVRLRTLLGSVEAKGWVEILTGEAQELVRQLGSKLAREIQHIRVHGPASLLREGPNSEHPTIQGMIRYVYRPSPVDLDNTAAIPPNVLEATEMVAGFAGYCAGMLQYARDPLEQKQWSAVGFRFFLELGVQHALLRREVSPEIADKLWDAARTRIFAAGYALALRENLDQLLADSHSPSDPTRQEG